MNDKRIDFSCGKAITVSLWAWTVAVMGAAWVALFAWGPGVESLWMMLGFTACASSALAATAQIRCYVTRICGLLRVTAGLETPDAAVHSIR